MKDCASVVGKGRKDIKDMNNISRTELAYLISAKIGSIESLGNMEVAVGVKDNTRYVMALHTLPTSDKVLVTTQITETDIPLAIADGYAHTRAVEIIAELLRKRYLHTQELCDYYKYEEWCVG